MVQPLMGGTIQLKINEPIVPVAFSYDGYDALQTAAAIKIQRYWRKRSTKPPMMMRYNISSSVTESVSESMTDSDTDSNQIQFKSIRRGMRPRPSADPRHLFGPPPDTPTNLNFDQDQELGWTPKKINSIENILLKLKYNRIISYFFFHELKKREQSWSWIIILISTFTSGLTVLNTIDEDKIPIPNFETINNMSLTVFSMITSLVATWIKKERYVERLNELDRYSQKINKICEEIDFELIKSSSDRNNYKQFKDKQFPLISEYLGSNPSMSPKEWKRCIIKISTKYPELITWSGSNDEKLWPWYSENIRDKERINTNFLETSMNSYKKKWFYFC